MAEYSPGTRRNLALFDKQDSEELPDGGSKIISDLSVHLDETTCRVVDIPSNDPFLPPVHELGNTLDDISCSILFKDGFTFYPKNMCKNPSPTMKDLCLRMEEAYANEKQCFVYLSHSLSVIFNIPCQEKRPDEVVCDVCVVSHHKPVFVLTVVEDGKQSRQVTEYNLNIVKGLVSEVRNFTDEHFSAVYGVLTQSDIQSAQSFQLAVDNIETMSSTLCIPDSLSMSEDKFRNVLKALTASIAISRALEVLKTPMLDAEDLAGSGDQDQESGLWLLTKEQFNLLTENIDTPGLVIVWASPHTGSTTLMLEVASRLEKLGKTLLVSGSERVCQSARRNKICSRVIDRDDFLSLGSVVDDVLSDVHHVVAEDVPESLLQHHVHWQVWLCLKIKDKQTASLGKSVVSKHDTTKTDKSREHPVVSIRNRRPLHKETVNFKMLSDVSDPWIYDFTVVNINGINVIVALDPHNDKVKSFCKVDGNMKTGYISIDKGAKGITNLNNMAGITVPASRLIRIISVTPDLYPHRIIHTERRYYAIAGYGPDKIVACSPKDGRPCVDITDYTGTILKSITKDEDGISLFHYPLTLHATFPKILVYDKQNGCLVCVNDRGQVLFKYSPEKKLENPCGMTITPAGDILVGESRAHRIVVLSQEGELVEEILTRADNVIFPYRLCCDGDGLLYAALHYKEVRIYDFEQEVK